MNILVIAAHPDDEVLGCGGSIVKWSNMGYDVNILIMSEGVTSRDKVRNRKLRTKELTKLGEAAKKSSTILGANSINLLDFPDNRMDTIALLDVTKEIEKYIIKLKPQIVVTHHGNDLNIDHRIIFNAVLTACRPQPEISVEQILSFEVPSSTEWQSPTIHNTFFPNWYEDISKTLFKKIEALKVYNSEMRNWPHSRSIKAIEYLARWRGASCGCNASEAFMLVRKINRS